MATGIPDGQRIVNIDLYRELFQQLVADGMTHADAIHHFDPDLLRAAVNEEMERGDCARFFNMETLSPENACGHETLFDLTVKASFEQRQIDDFNNQALPLYMAGWTSEEPNPTNSKDFWRQTQIMSLYWRAPSKRPGKPGRRYLSTQQAFNAIQRAAA